MHSRIMETDRNIGICTPPKPCYGGFARVAYEVKRIKSMTPNSLFLNAGDSYQGTAFYSIFKWKVLLPFMHMLGIDVMSLGNHEFDDGVAGLSPYLQQIRIPTVTCNLDTTKEPSLIDHTTLKPWHMLQVENVKIAIIGYLTPDTKFLASTGEVQFLDEIERIKYYVNEVKNAGANLIFALGHSGYFKDQEIAKNIPEIDLVVGGHTDTFLYTGTQPDREIPVAEYPLLVTQKSGKKVPVVQAYGYTKYLGKLDTVWDDNFKLVSATGNPILLDRSVPKDPDVENEISIWESKLNGTLQVRTGSSKVFLDGNCRQKECNIGNLITDAFTHHVVVNSKGADWTEAPITILNSGAIRASIQNSDNITWGDLITVLPFGNQLVRLKMKGSTLLKALHRSVERYDINRTVGFGEFLQVSGLKIEYIQQNNGSLILKSAQARCGKCPIPKYEHINPYKDYSVNTILFVAEGGDKYDMLKKEAIKEEIYEKVDLDIVTNYIKQLSPVYPAEEERIIIPENLRLSHLVASSYLIKYNRLLIITCLSLFIRHVNYNNY